MRKTWRMSRPVGIVAALALLTSACTGPATQSPSATAGAPASAAASATAAPTEAAWAPEFVDGVLQPLPDGFPSGQITIATQGEAGDDDGIYARQFQEAAGAISPVAVNVIDRPDFGNQWELVNWVTEQPGGTDGAILQVATFPGAAMDLLVVPIEQELGLTLADFDTIMLSENVPYVLISRIDAPWGTDIAKFIEYAKANEGTVKALIRGPDSATTLSYQDFARKVGIVTNDVVGGSSSDIIATIGAGEGDVAMTLVGNSLPVIEAGRAVVLSCTGASDPCAGPFDPVPSIAGITGEISPWGGNRGMTINNDAPDLHRAWMDAFVRAVVATDGFKEARLKVPGLSLTDGANAEKVELSKAAYTVAYDILKDQGLLDPSAPLPDDLDAGQ
jgi:tripartite-type tricarboxylate transporter receptor subunit TctC